MNRLSWHLLACYHLTLLGKRGGHRCASYQRHTVQVPVFAFGHAMSRARPHAKTCISFFSQLPACTHYGTSVSPKTSSNLRAWKTTFSESRDSSSVEICQLLIVVSSGDLAWQSFSGRIPSPRISIRTRLVLLFIPLVRASRLHVHCDCNHLNLPSDLSIRSFLLGVVISMQSSVYKSLIIPLRMLHVFHVPDTKHVSSAWQTIKLVCIDYFCSN